MKEMVEPDSLEPDTGRGKRMSNLLSQGQRFAIPLPGLVWIPEQPQDVSQKGETGYTDIPSMASNCRATLLGVVKGKYVLKVGAS